MKQGAALAQKGEHEAALSEFRKAQALVPNANLPHRAEAESLEALGRLEDARAAYRRYLEIKPNVSDANLVTEKIASLDARIATKQTAPAATPPAEPAPVAAPTQEPAPIGAPAPTVTERRSEPVRQTIVSPLRTVGWIGLAAGAAVTTGAVVFDLAVVGRAKDDFDTTRMAGDGSALGKADDLESLQTVGLVGYAAGGLLLVGGAVLVLLAPKTRVVETTTSSVRVRF
jgi:tetratricopeptide (TPR) repeat protein